MRVELQARGSVWRVVWRALSCIVAAGVVLACGAASGCSRAERNGWTDERIGMLCLNGVQGSMTVVWSAVSTRRTAEKLLALGDAAKGNFGSYRDAEKEIDAKAAAREKAMGALIEKLKGDPMQFVAICRPLLAAAVEPCAIEYEFGSDSAIKCIEQYADPPLVASGWKTCALYSDPGEVKDICQSKVDGLSGRAP
jgi:hypothetical protein